MSKALTFLKNAKLRSNLILRLRSKIEINILCYMKMRQKYVMRKIYGKKNLFLKLAVVIFCVAS